MHSHTTQTQWLTCMTRTGVSSYGGVSFLTSIIWDVKLSVVFSSSRCTNLAGSPSLTAFLDLIWNVGTMGIFRCVSMMSRNTRVRACPPYRERAMPVHAPWHPNPVHERNEGQTRWVPSLCCIFTPTPRLHTHRSTTLVWKKTRRRQHVTYMFHIYMHCKLHPYLQTPCYFFEERWRKRRKMMSIVLMFDIYIHYMPKPGVRHRNWIHMGVIRYT